MLEGGGMGVGVGAEGGSRLTASISGPSLENWCHNCPVPYTTITPPVHANLLEELQGNAGHLSLRNIG